jgi:hypothetical protein
VRRLEDDGTVDHLGQLCGNKGSNSLRRHEFGDSITAPTACRSLAHIERIHDAALDENAALILKDVAGDFPTTDDQGVRRIAVGGLWELGYFLSGRCFLAPCRHTLQGDLPATLWGKSQSPLQAAFCPTIRIHSGLLAASGSARYYLLSGELQVEFGVFREPHMEKNSILSAPYFHDEQAAYDFVEARLWPNGPVCPKCALLARTTS